METGLGSAMATLVAARRLTEATTIANGRVLQLGDNDNGRLLKLSPAVEIVRIEAARARFSNLDGWLPPSGMDGYPLEDPQDHAHLLQAIGELVSREDHGDPEGMDGAVVRQLAGPRRARPMITKATMREWADTGRALATFDERLAALSPSAWEQYVIELPPGALAEPNCMPFPDFGLYLVRSSRVLVSIRCGRVGQGGRGGHDHR